MFPDNNHQNFSSTEIKFGIFNISLLKGQLNPRNIILSLSRITRA
jgi:hypothetical protein